MWLSDVPENSIFLEGVFFKFKSMWLKRHLENDSQNISRHVRHVAMHVWNQNRVLWRWSQSLTLNDSVSYVTALYPLTVRLCVLYRSAQRCLFWTYITLTALYSNLFWFIKGWRALPCIVRNKFRFLLQKGWLYVGRGNCRKAVNRVVVRKTSVVLAVNNLCLSFVLLRIAIARIVTCFSFFVIKRLQIVGCVQQT